MWGWSHGMIGMRGQGAVRSGPQCLIPLDTKVGHLLGDSFFLQCCFWAPTHLANQSNLAALVPRSHNDISGFIPFTIQAFTGCALDRTWVARYSRTESPIKYWSLLIFSAAFGTVFALIANRFT